MCTTYELSLKLISDIQVVMLTRLLPPRYIMVITEYVQ